MSDQQSSHPGKKPKLSYKLLKHTEQRKRKWATSTVVKMNIIGSFLEDQNEPYHFSTFNCIILM